uniref:phospholipase A2 inhibitor and Ly6/PLAUR domain-containing protein n=1 Tax=Doryrhamphus excisus TaxID=161450 RepID=UPI0025AECACA|nr:phospholipase A2 inhibitor and Ly6/PLAUR domain-containing protein [Doryrhamphus excisus]
MKCPVAMKLFLLAVCLASLLAAGQALDCHRCVPKKAGGDCELSVETCRPEKDGCAAASFLSKPYGHYQKCMALSDCHMLKMNAFINITCCDSDMCNAW